MNKQKIDILSTAESWINSGRSIAIATVITTWGSSPRPVGSILIVDQDGNFEGSVSGGCVESAVIEASQSVIKTGKVQVLDFGVSDEEAWEVGLACGGNIKVMIFNCSLSLEQEKILKQLNLDRKKGQTLAHCINIESGKQTILYNNGKTFGNQLAKHIHSQATEAINKRESLFISKPNNQLFIHIHNPSLNLIIIGATHITQSLAEMAHIVGFDVYIIDPRQAFGSAKRFANINVETKWPDEFFIENPPNNSTAIVTLTHDPKIDDPALEIAIRSNAFYIGALGSTRTHKRRLDRLNERGFSYTDLKRIYSPVGLQLNAKSPSEIALSTLAEIVQVSRKVSS